MKGRKKPPGQVGIRELRQNLTVYLRRVQKGETLDVTDRGKPVAILAPVVPAASPLERLIAEGRATRPVGSLADLGLPPRRAGRALSEVLEELRQDRL
jgi:prevent-host-death family protein